MRAAKTRSFQREFMDTSAKRWSVRRANLVPGSGVLIVVSKELES
jgi:hypothetical protein